MALAGQNVSLFFYVRHLVGRGEAISIVQDARLHLHFPTCERGDRGVGQFFLVG